MREPDGLAMSSRNAYLAQDERRKAPEIYRTLKAAAESLRHGKKSIDGIEKEALGRLEKAGFRPEYVSIRRTEESAHAGARRYPVIHPGRRLAGPGPVNRQP